MKTLIIYPANPEDPLSVERFEQQSHQIMSNCEGRGGHHVIDRGHRDVPRLLFQFSSEHDAVQARHALQGLWDIYTELGD